ncbi:MAG: precorrin-6y C5,15-methyltransferase (decarboxylating) subunit CbiE [Pseudomonadota bacterium]
MTPWLHIVGIGAGGIESLGAEARDAVAEAEIILGSDRHHALVESGAERLSWPSPFDALIDTVAARRGTKTAVLVTGDPLWYSVGAMFARAFAREELAFHPQLAAFQLAAARLGWPLTEVEMASVHGRPVESILPRLAPDTHLLILAEDRGSPAAIAALLRRQGYGASRIVVLAEMETADERRFEGIAATWDAEVPDFHTIAVECRADATPVVLPCTPGLPDTAFEHDGKMTKAEVRAVTLARLMPLPGALLWDIGAGCGSVGIEWMRAADRATAIGLEPRADRRAMAERNARALGTPCLQLIDGRAPDALADLPAPDAVFIGGGLSPAVVEACRAALKPHGRLVANAVTLESERLLIDLHARFGGMLTRLSVARAEPVGDLTGWRPMMPVTQWSLGP